jgi:hypothetical protein
MKRLPTAPRSGKQGVVVRSTKVDHWTELPTAVDHPRYLCTGQSYLERLGILYMDEIRLTILRACSMREMGRLEFFETIGGTSYDSIRRHFLKLVETGWLRKVRTVSNGPGRPEALYRATELAVIDEETWARIPLSIRDTFTAMLLEDMGSGLARALEDPVSVAEAEQPAAFTILPVDARAWGRALAAFMRCYRTLAEVQIDAKVRLDGSDEQPQLLVVHLGAFEAPGPQFPPEVALPKAPRVSSPVPWPRRIGKVFSDQLDLAILDRLNAAPMTADQLHGALGGATTEAFLRRCKRLTKLGLAVNLKTQAGAGVDGGSVHRFRAATPNITEDDILSRIPPSARSGQDWETFRSFIVASIAAVEAGTFNTRPDRHLTKSTLLVDRLGWAQATNALRDLEATLLQLDADSAGQPHRVAARRFPAAFLLSSFPAPLSAWRL